MAKFKVEIEGPFMELYRYFREKGYGIKESKELAKPKPVVIEFDEFETFSECVKEFHRPGFVVNGSADFEHKLPDMPIGNAFADPDEEELNIRDLLTKEFHLNNVEIINAILFWQKSEDVKHLTCGNDSNHRLLVPGIDTENDTIVLGCQDCDYIEEKVPDAVLEYYNSKFKPEK